MRIDCAASSCSACASRSAATRSRIGAGIGEHDDLGRPGDHVDADDAEHPPLGRRDIGVAGADDLGDRRDGLGAVGERGDRLRAADAVDFVDAGDACAAASTSGLSLPSGVGTTMARRRQPATFAGAAFMITEEG